ncbi:ADP-ribosyl cyclase/cyclic ADP-ribose hydrolase-like [Saccostrea echinata]|uniref:ADP-ribosyl cyclase/cyclic ADP-ribose hydrolase-like n=1 Tax=Saccostrea echinata TaxID=191078 RepID=UPI002A8104DD|nr:ADP-ribosyl cyclase/cyclic ADP-ribose hydrolase-like [Saccostrea echinata]
MLYSAITAALLPMVFALSPVGQEFVGKCLYYQTTLNPLPFTDNKKNCSLLWESFRDAIAFQSPCHVDRQRFAGFCNESQHHVPSNKFVFWEHVYETVMRYTNRGKRAFSISDTLTGFLGDTKFCGSNSSSDGVEQDRSKCPGYEQTPTCPWPTEAAFWATASEYYSKSAQGEVEIMLDATSDPLFTNESYFIRFELPNLKDPRVTAARILLAHNSALPPRETCSGQSVEFLRRKLSDNGVTNVTCKINPSSLKFQLCSENPVLPFCSLDCDPNGAPLMYHQQVFIICWLLVTVTISTLLY